MDALSQVLRALRLTGTVYFRANFSAPWGMKMQGGPFANFHLVVSGTCWVRHSKDSDAIELRAGDLVLFPHGDTHSLVENPGTEADPAEAVLATEREDGSTTVFGGDGPVTTTLLCGHFSYDRSGSHPLFSHLPAMLLVRSSQEANTWISVATQLAELETKSDQYGSSASVDRLAEVLLIGVLRSYLESMDTPTGFLAALGDPGLCHVLLEIHNAPKEAWTVERAATIAGMSRSVFADRFRANTGMTPMQYVTHFRLLHAKELLLSSQASLAEIAADIGYQSEFSFAKAFKKQFGSPPGQFRKSA